MTDGTMTSAITGAMTSAIEPMLRADRRGYVLDGDSIDGFEDRPDVGLEGRIKLLVGPDTSLQTSYPTCSRNSW